MPDPDALLSKYTGTSQQQALGSPFSVMATSSGKFSDQSTVYLPGNKYITKTPNRFDTSIEKGSSGGRNTVLAGQAKSMPLSWMQNDPETLKQFVNTGILNKVPGFDVGMGMPEIMKAWENLIEQSWMMNKYMPGGEDKKLTPWDVLNSYSNSKMNFGSVRRGDWLYDIATGEKLKYVGPKSKTTTQKKVDLSSAEDVRAIATNALAELLGRAPTAEEMAKFKSSINALEEKNPITATTTETLNDMGEVISTSTRQEGGLSAEARGLAVSGEVKKGPEYGKFQSGTTYWGALMQMLGG